MKRLFTCIFFISFCYMLFAQQTEKDIVYLKTGEIIKGEVISQGKNTVKVKTAKFGIVTYQTAEISKIEHAPKKSANDNKKYVYLKSGESFSGWIIERSSTGNFKLLIDGGKTMSFHTVEVDHISDKPDPEPVLPIDTVQVKSGTEVGKAFVITQEDTSHNEPQESAINTNSSKSKPNATNKFEQLTAKYVKGLRVGLGGVLSDASYFLGQVGLYSYIPINKTPLIFIPEIDLGLAHGNSRSNMTLNLVPMLRYNFEHSQFSVDAGFDIYFRFYDGGVKVRPGILVGGNYSLTSSIDVGARVGYYNAPYIGFSFGYNFGK